jgi:hypothetical protein
LDECAEIFHTKEIALGWRKTTDESRAACVVFVRWFSIFQVTLTSALGASGASVERVR